MKSYRVEIIANQAVEEDLIDRLAVHGAGERYTRLAPVFGRGSSGQRLGDHVWPEENFMLLIYCDEEEYRALVTAVTEVKGLYPEEGVKLFAQGGEFLEA